MTDKLHEQLSALVDDELSADERELLYRRLEQQPPLRAKWSRYHALGDMIRGHVQGDARLDISRSIQAAIAQDTTYAAKPVAPRWMRPLSGAALAATVAFMAVLGIQKVTVTDTQVELAPVAQLQTPAQAIPVSGTRWDVQRPELATRLNGYLVNHSEYASGTNLQGMLQYVRIAGYDQEN